MDYEYFLYVDLQLMFFSLDNLPMLRTLRLLHTICFPKKKKKEKILTNKNIIDFTVLLLSIKNFILYVKTVGAVYTILSKIVTCRIYF